MKPTLRKENLLCCPVCKNDFSFEENTLKCKKCKKNYYLEDGIYKLLPSYSSDVELSIQKWDLLYKNQYDSKSYLKDLETYKKTFFKDVYRQINTAKPFKGLVYLEIGCGPFYFGSLVAKECDLVIGIDFCPHALKIAKEVFKSKGIENYLLIQGNILNMPLKEDSVDLVYGGGVIEHFKDTSSCINELFRVLKNEGLSVNTVPYLNIGSLTYRQVWGNIPNVPLLRDFFEFIHIKLLGGKHMIFGYEMSFLGNTLKKLHKKAGFKNVRVEKFDVELSFDFAPRALRKSLIGLANSSPFFWPMVKVLALK